MATYKIVFETIATPYLHAKAGEKFSFVVVEDDGYGFVVWMLWDQGGVSYADDIVRIQDMGEACERAIKGALYQDDKRQRYTQ